MKLKRTGPSIFIFLMGMAVVTAAAVVLDTTVKNYLYDRFGEGFAVTSISALSNLSWLFFPNQLNLPLWRLGMDQAIASFIVLAATLATAVAANSFRRRIGVWRFISLYVAISLVSFVGTIAL